MKGKPTPKQDKWKDPFFRTAIASRAGNKGMLRMWDSVNLRRKAR